ncbi:CpaD family pilus assembly protein [Sphingomonas sp.]|uniref:CpaD family pilus assembly protein n=1 Tax=Sphingomonas sp. TaxID=28214 RepID=UPI0025D956ED|nr:CpaD family pilus assembly protein [Sphingomonas sp.]
MRRHFVLLAIIPALSGCLATAQDKNPSALRGVEPVNVPVVSRADYALDLTAPGGSLPSSEAGRLDGWFRSLQLGYGDNIYVDGPDANGARSDVARVAGRFGMLVSNGAPVTAGDIAPGTVRVVVSRTTASVPGCPNWSGRSQPNLENKSMSNFGCSVNANLAAMVANPEDLVQGREGSGIGDTLTATKAVESYRRATPTGDQGLKDINTKKEK